MILIDFSQLAIAGVFAFSSDFKKGSDTEKMSDIMRHAFLTSVLGYKAQYGKRYGEIVFACDGSNNWRKSAFKFYKQHRAKDRAESEMDWGAIFKLIDVIRTELETVFPWRVIRHDNAEGDDVIAVLTKMVTEADSTVEGSLFDDPEPVLIVSSDGDFKQLHSLGDVVQINPMMKKRVEKPTTTFLIEKIITGDKGDGVPSVLCGDDFFVNEDSGRAPPVTKKVIERFKAGIGLSEEEKRRFERNRQLISFEYIPETIKQEIVSLYNATTPKKDLNRIMEFLMEKRARQLLGRVQEFK